MKHKHIHHHHHQRNPGCKATFAVRISETHCRKVIAAEGHLVHPDLLSEPHAFPQPLYVAPNPTPTLHSRQGLWKLELPHLFQLRNEPDE